MVEMARPFGLVAGVAPTVRLLDDIHSLAHDFTRAVDALERYLQLRVRESGQSPPVAAAFITDEQPLKQSKLEYYDADLVIRLNEATERYVTNTGEWPTEEQRRAFIEENVDFSQELI